MLQQNITESENSNKKAYITYKLLRSNCFKGYYSFLNPLNDEIIVTTREGLIKRIARGEYIPYTLLNKLNKNNGGDNMNLCKRKHALSKLLNDARQEGFNKNLIAGYEMQLNELNKVIAQERAHIARIAEDLKIRQELNQQISAGNPALV